MSLAWQCKMTIDAKRKRFKERQRRKIRKWFKARFDRKPSEDRVYYEEWVDRFERGDAFLRMDKESLALWHKVNGGMM